MDNSTASASSGKASPRAEAAHHRGAWSVDTRNQLIHRKEFWHILVHTFFLHTLPPALSCCSNPPPRCRRRQPLARCRSARRSRRGSRRGRRVGGVGVLAFCRSRRGRRASAGLFFEGPARFRLCSGRNVDPIHYTSTLRHEPTGSHSPLQTLIMHIQTSSLLLLHCFSEGHHCSFGCVKDHLQNLQHHLGR